MPAIMLYADHCTLFMPLYFMHALATLTIYILYALGLIIAYLLRLYSETFIPLDLFARYLYICLHNPNEYTNFASIKRINIHNTQYDEG